MIWIAADAYSHRKIISGKDDLLDYDDFMKVELNVNLRNCESIVKEAFRRDDSDYKKDLIFPQPNFPKGLEPIHVSTLKEAITEMRKVTNEGILAIGYWESHKDFHQILNGMGLKGKVYDKYENDFNKGESPYQYLLDGNILLIGEHGIIDGFEWQNIISTNRSSIRLGDHPCNWFMRCTTNLIIVDEK